MKTLIAVSTTITAVISLLFLAMCGTAIYSVGEGQRKMQECETKLRTENPGATDADISLSCLEWLRDQ